MEMHVYLPCKRVLHMGLFRKVFNRWLGRGIDFFGFSMNGCHYDIPLDGVFGQNAAYDRCSTLKTVVNRNARAMANGVWWITDNAGNDVTEKYFDIAVRLTTPNPIQTFSEFIMQMDVYRQLRGEVFVYFAAPVGSSASAAYSWWVIDPRYVEIETTGILYGGENIEDIITRYWLNAGGQRTELDRSRLLHIKDVNQNLDFCPSDIGGVTRLYSVQNSVNNLIVAEEALLSMNKDRGALGILSNDTDDAAGHVPMSPEEQNRLQEKFKARYGLQQGQWKVIITDAKLKWQSMTMSVKELQLLEGMTENIQLICNAFDYPYELLANTNNVTYANKQEAKKSWYEDTIIPMSRIYAEGFTRMLLGLGGDKFVMDFSTLSCLKTAEADRAKTYYQKAVAVRELYTLGIISREEARIELDYNESIEGKATMYSPQGTDRGNTQEA